MRRTFLLLALLPLAGCAFMDDYLAYSDPNAPTPCGTRPTLVRACDGSIQQVSAQLPAQTVEPPR